ncbi:hypothetical protein GCM10027203_81260 [Nonomuraea fastidiosa]
MWGDGGAAVVREAVASLGPEGEEAGGGVAEQVEGVEVVGVSDEAPVQAGLRAVRF